MPDFVVHHTVRRDGGGFMGSVGSEGDRGCPGCGMRAQPTKPDDAQPLFVVDSRDRYWCLRCVVLVLGEHTRVREGRAFARYTWSFDETWTPEKVTP